MTSREKKNLTTVVAIVIIGIAGYIGFGPLFDKFSSGVTGQFLAAIFGTIFTIILTMFLLNKQSEIEEEKSRGESVFNERVELYKQVIDQMNNIVEDGNISITEMNRLQFMLVKLQMVADDSTIQRFINVYDSVSNAFSRTKEEDENEEKSDNNETPIEPEDKIAILESMLQFSQSCRVELGLASSEKINTELFSKTAESLKKSQKAVEEKKVGGVRSEMNLAFRDLIPDLVKKSKYFDKSKYKDVSVKGYPDPARDFYTVLINNNDEQNYIAILNIYPNEDGSSVKFRYQTDVDFMRTSDDYEATGFKKLVEETLDKYKAIDDKYKIFTPGKKHLQLITTRDKMRRSLYYQTYTMINLKDLNDPIFQQKMVDCILEVASVKEEFKEKAEEKLNALGTSLKTLYRDSRVGMAGKDDENEEEK